MLSDKTKDVVSCQDNDVGGKEQQNPSHGQLSAEGGLLPEFTIGSFQKNFSRRSAEVGEGGLHLLG
jgi:hypothetical protein